MMRVLILLYSFLCSSAWAQESEWNRAFNIIWESRWQQTGIPMPAVRWPSESKTIKFSINKAASSSNANRARESLGVITKVLDWKAIEVDEDSTDAQIEITIRPYKDDELRSSACHAAPAWQNFLYTKQKLSLSEQYAYRCVLHELMHAFGFPGHPQGDTVLSYFQGNQSSLKPMDEFLLKTWYSNDIKMGVSPFITVNELAKQWVIQNVPQAQQEAAAAVQTQWHRNLMKTMEDFANGKGEPPAILYRSGRISEEGIRLGRTNIQGMLGAAYLNGWTIDKDTAKAARLLLIGAQAGNPGAAGILARQLKANTWGEEEARPLCQWLHTTPQAITKIASADQQAALDSSMCKQILVR
jgi:hypothetical protein